MTRKGWYFLAWGFGAALLLTACSADAKPGKETKLQEIMTRLHRGDNSIRRTIDDDLSVEDKDPDWVEIQKLTKQYLEGATEATKQTPPQGTKESWEEFSKKYIAAAKELDDAAQKKDRKEAQAAHLKLVMGCADCHAAHRPKDK